MKLSAKTLRSLLTGTALLAVGTALPAWADYQSTILSQGPVGYWRLNETTQPQPTAPAANLGSLGASAAGTYNNFPTRGVAGPFAGSVAVELSGAAGVSVATPWQAALNPTAFSAEIWANPAVVPNFAYVMSSAQIGSPRTGWYMAQDDGGVFGAGSAFVVRMFFNSGTTPSVQLAAPANLPVGSWYHLVLTYDGTTASLYENGVLVTNRAAAYVANASGQYIVGGRSDNNFYWPGKVAEAAMYSGALSAAQVAAHYAAATTAPATYSTTVLANSPLLYWRFAEAADPVAANSGTLGSDGDGLYFYNARPGVGGPAPTGLPGFDAGNKAVAFDGVGGGVVRVPPLNLDANTVTITAWINATNSQTAATGLVLCRAGTTVAGLTIDAVGGGLGLGYVWNDDPNTYNWSPTIDALLPTLPDSQWAFAALIVSPDQAAIYLGDPSNAGLFVGVTNVLAHAVQNFDGVTFFGADLGSFNPPRYLNGALDEVAIFNRTLGVGEVFTEFATAVGGRAPQIFTDLQPPADPVYEGNPLVLKIDAGGTAPLTFTWHRGGSTIAITTNAVLTIPSASLSDSGNYDVTVSNGSGSVPSQQVPITVNTASAPNITQSQGFLNRTLYAGGSLKLSVTATGGGLKYQWYKSSSPIASATTSAYTIASVTNSDAGSYSVSITNTLGAASNGPVAITIPSTPAGSYEALLVNSAPEAWWRLDEAPGSTTLFDGMGRHDGRYTNLSGNVPPVVLGVPGALANDPSTAASFTPGNNGIGLIPFSAALNPGQFTVEAWVKTSVLDGIVPLSSNDPGGNGWWFQAISGWWYGDCGAGYFGNNGNVNTAAAVTPGQWSHVVIRYDSTQVINGTHFPFTLYVNGQTDGFVWGSAGLNATSPFIIGGRGASVAAVVDRLFDGQVDEVAFYRRILGQTEIQSHFQGRFGTTTPPYFIGAFTPQTVPTGKDISFSTVVQGSFPIRLQWYKDASLLNGATNTTLNITNTAVSDTGNYTLWATNGAGTASQSVALNVVPLVGYANVTNGLVLHLRFDGNANDSSGRGNNGSEVGGPAYVTGLIGPQALQYSTESVTNGSTVTVTASSYVNLGTPADLHFGTATSFTVGLWVKLPLDAEPGDLPFIGNAINSNLNPGWDLSPSYGGGSWQWNLNDGVSPGLAVTNNFNMSGTELINDGTWHHFVLTVDRTAKLAKSYLDSILVATRDITSLGSVDTTSPITVGQDPTGTYPEAWTATLDDVGIWRQALTPLEVTQIYSAGSTAGRSFDTVSTQVIMTVSRSGTSVTINWSSGTLQQSDTVGAGASWSAVPGATAPSYTVNPATGNKYYRVLVQ